MFVCLGQFGQIRILSMFTLYKKIPLRLIFLSHTTLLLSLLLFFVSLSLSLLFFLSLIPFFSRFLSILKKCIHSIWTLWAKYNHQTFLSSRINPIRSTLPPHPFASLSLLPLLSPQLFSLPYFSPLSLSISFFLFPFSSSPSPLLFLFLHFCWDILKAVSFFQIFSVSQLHEHQCFPTMFPEQYCVDTHTHLGFESVGLGYGSELEQLPSIHEAPSPIPSTEKEKEMKILCLTKHVLDFQGLHFIAQEKRGRTRWADDSPLCIWSLQ